MKTCSFFAKVELHTSKSEFNRKKGNFQNYIFFNTIRGARHGIKMNGKLARIEQMEKLEHDRLMAEKSKKTFDTVENSNGDSSIEKRKKKKKKKKSSEEDEETNEVVKKKKKN